MIRPTTDDFDRRITDHTEYRAGLWPWWQAQSKKVKRAGYTCAMLTVYTLLPQRSDQ